MRMRRTVAELGLLRGRSGGGGGGRSAGRRRRSGRMTAMAADRVLHGALDCVHDAAGTAVHAAAAAAVVAIAARRLGRVFGVLFLLHLGFGARPEHIEDGRPPVWAGDACRMEQVLRPNREVISEMQKCASCKHL